MLKPVENFDLKRNSRQRVHWLCVLLVAGLSQAIPSGMYAQNPPKASDDSMVQELVRANQELIHQIQDLQNRVKQLEAKVMESGPKDASAIPSARPSETSVTPAAPAVTPAAAVVVQEPESKAFDSGVKLRVFGDVGYGVSDQKGETNSFHIGSLELFMTGSLSDRVSILGEVIFLPRIDNSIETDVERLLLQYKHNDHFTFGIGRYHSSIGYYDTAFHQGAWFQAATDRPFMYQIDDEGGFLPMHEVGITINGQIPSGKLGLNYVAEMGNGRAHRLDREPAQNRRDTNNGKSFNLALFARPNWVPGLQAGFSIYHDFLTFPDNQ